MLKCQHHENDHDKVSDLDNGNHNPGLMLRDVRDVNVLSSFTRWLLSVMLSHNASCKRCRLFIRLCKYHVQIMIHQIMSASDNLNDANTIHLLTSVVFN